MPPPLAPESMVPAVAAHTASLALWLDAQDPATLFQDTAGTVPVTASLQQVSRWADKSGKGNHVLQNAAYGAAPKFSSSLINGLPGLDFSGSAALLSSPTNKSLDSTVFIVASFNNTPVPYGVVWGHFLATVAPNGQLGPQADICLRMRGAEKRVSWQSNGDYSCYVNYNANTPTLYAATLLQGTSR